MDINDRIKEVALVVSPEYPGIETAEPFEQLWAIEQGYLGTNSANKDCHKLIDHMRQQLGWTKEQTVDEWLKIKGHTGFDGSP